VQLNSVRTRLLLLAALLAALLPLAPVADADPSPPGRTSSFRTTYGYIPVAQGDPLTATELHYKVELPDPNRFGPGPYPTVVDYSGYYPGLYIYDGLAEKFLDQGYAVAGVNIRGTGCSGGRFDYFEPLESRDGAEAIDWLGEQPWSNGRVAMVGKSYPGITQLFVAPQRPRHLVAIVPGSVFGDLYRDVPYPGGILNAAFAGGWSAGRIADQGLIYEEYPTVKDDPKCMQHQAEHAPNAPFNPFVRAVQPQNNFDGDLYHERSPWYFADQINVPVMLVEAFQDEEVGSRAMELIERLAPGLPWRMSVTNGDHGEYYGEEMFPQIARFLAYYLRQQVPAGDAYEGLSFDDALTLYQAEDRVTWNVENGANGGRKAAYQQTFDTWPPSDTEVWRLALTGAHTLEPVPNASLLKAHGKGLSRSAAADPADAPPAVVTYNYAPGIGSQERGGFDIRGEPPASWSDRPQPGTFAEFTTAPLESDKVLFGPASADLWVSSTAADTDFEVTVSEVRPDGKEMFVEQGWLRASHRKLDPAQSTALRPYQTHLATDIQPLVPGTPTPVRIEVFPFGHVFRAGSQLRFTVAAPHVRPDLWGFAALPAPAVNTIYTGGAYASTLALPLMGGLGAQQPLPPCTLRNQPCR
jgi:putative CocE/NonD family hydrolase